MAILQQTFRIFLILFFIYSTMFGGIGEHHPYIKVFHQVSATLLFTVWVGIKWRRKSDWPVTAMDWPLWLAGLGWLAAALASPDVRVSLEYTWPIFVHILLMLLFVDLMQSGRMRWVFESLFIASAIVALLGILEIVTWYFGLSIFPQLGFEQSWPALAGFSIPPEIRAIWFPMGHKNILGAHCVLMIPLAMAFASSSHERSFRWAFRLLAIGLTVILLASQSRGAYLGLAAIIGIGFCFLVLHPQVQLKFPPLVRSLLIPRNLIVAVALAGIAAIVLVLWLILGRATPDPDDICRLDLWKSAIDIFRDHPILGVGAYQYGSVRLEYPNWAESASYISLRTAHNLVLNTLAEGGIVVFTLLTWLTVTFGKMWWVTWRRSTPRTRIRLEGVLTALIAFSVHNMVDTFLSIQGLLPVLVMVAYVAHQHQRQGLPMGLAFPSSLRRRMPLLTLGALAIIQLTFIPLHLGALAHQRAMGALADGDLVEALEKSRDAQEMDRWMGLYLLQEAAILGQLADEDPGTYLDEAIAAHEQSLALKPTWHLGWHNLAALYAQAGRFDEAIRAERTASDWYPNEAGYHFKLGEHYELVGSMDEASLAYYEALRLSPSIAQSDFWTDPQHPERLAVLSEAVTFLADDPKSALDVAMYAGDSPRAIAIARTIPRATAGPQLQQRLDILLSEEFGLCEACYFLTERYGKLGQIRHYLVQAEYLMLYPQYPTSDGFDVAESTRAALFVSNGGDHWVWYLLARQADDDAQAHALLRRTVWSGTVNDYWFARTVYGTMATLELLPQGRFPLLSPFGYQPWLELAALYERDGNWPAARETYEQILEKDPFAWRVQALLDALPKQD